MRACHLALSVNRRMTVVWTTVDRCPNQWIVIAKSILLFFFFFAIRKCSPKSAQAIIERDSAWPTHEQWERVHSLNILVARVDDWWRYNFNFACLSSVINRVSDPSHSVNIRWIYLCVCHNKGRPLYVFICLHAVMIAPLWATIHGLVPADGWICGCDVPHILPYCSPGFNGHHSRNWAARLRNEESERSNDKLQLDFTLSPISRLAITSLLAWIIL